MVQSAAQLEKPLGGIWLKPCSTIGGKHQFSPAGKLVTGTESIVSEALGTAWEISFSNHLQEHQTRMCSEARCEQEQEREQGRGCLTAAGGRPCFLGSRRGREPSRGARRLREGRALGAAPRRGTLEVTLWPVMEMPRGVLGRSAAANSYELLNYKQICS